MTIAAAPLTPRERVAWYFETGLRLVFWKPNGDIKGPQVAGWPQKVYTLDTYHEGDRVGILLGTEITPGQFVHDVDVDWEPGTLIAQKLLPGTEFVFGRPSKKFSHGLYTLPEAVPSIRYEDIDGTLGTTYQTPRFGALDAA